MLLEQTLDDLKGEVREIAELDAAAWRSFLGKLVEDRVIWTSVAGFAGGLLGVLPPITLAAAAVTLLSSVGTKGVAGLRAKVATLNSSEWCFIYELNKQKLKL